MKRNILFILTIVICFSFQSSESLFLKWNFKNFKELTFSFEQIMITKSAMLTNQISETVAKGNLIVKVNDINSSNIIFKNIHMIMSDVDSLGHKIETLQTEMPDHIIKGLKEDGKIESQLDAQSEILANVLFPVINRNLSINETFDLPLTMNFNSLGKQTKVSGSNSIKFTGNQNLETVIDISKPSNSDDKEKYISYLKGSSNYKFDNEKGYFTEGNIIIEMALGEIKGNLSNILIQTNSTIKLKLISVK
jgi:hypothetical protein